MSVASRVAAGLSLVAGEGLTAPRPAEANPDPGGSDARWIVPGANRATLSELFAGHSQDAGWAGFLLAQFGGVRRPLLWVQERMAILAAGRVHPPGLPCPDLIHVEARDARAALWAMEEGLRCAGLSGVIGELWGDPRALDFTATRRLAVAAERHGVPCWLVRLGGSANLSGARMRWHVESRPSLLHPFDAMAPGAPAWNAELFRARGSTPGRRNIAHEGGAEDPFRLVAPAGNRAMGEAERRRA